MRNPEKERLKVKLNLWETQGFSQFLSEFHDQILSDCKDCGGIEFWKSLKNLRREYTKRLQEIEDERNKLKQGKLDL